MWEKRRKFHIVSFRISLRSVGLKVQFMKECMLTYEWHWNISHGLGRFFLACHTEIY